MTDDAAKRAYLSNWDLGTVILDITKPKRPRYLGRTRLQVGEPQGDAHSAALGKFREVTGSIRLTDSHLFQPSAHGRAFF